MKQKPKIFCIELKFNIIVRCFPFKYLIWYEQVMLVGVNISLYENEQYRKWNYMNRNKGLKQCSLIWQKQYHNFRFRHAGKYRKNVNNIFYFLEITSTPLFCAYFHFICCLFSSKRGVCFIWWLVCQIYKSFGWADFWIIIIWHTNTLKPMGFF